MMADGYFQRLTRLTPTRFWVNNPTRDEADLAIAAGAVACTCNPSYGQKMLDHPAEGAYARRLLDEAVAESATDPGATAVLQRKLVKPIMDRFLPLWQGDPSRYGYVSIQGDPIREESAAAILEEAEPNRRLAPNACIKVPCTAAGLEAMGSLLGDGACVNATEVMSVAQTLSLVDLYERVTSGRARRPVMFVSHIAGIYDDYLQQWAAKSGVDVEPDVLWQAGLAVARRVYEVMRARGTPQIFIGGGARGLHHFTELVGGDLVVTINWVGTADRLIAENPAVVYRLFNPVPDHVVRELIEKVPDFKRAYLDDGLAVEEYEEFGGVEHFRHMFVSGWKRVEALAHERRAALAEGGGQR